MQCLRCQQDVPADAQFCPECGTNLAPICAHCETTNAPGHKFCKQCGQPLATFPQEAVGGPREAPDAEAERRQLTVMFCDLVGATELSEALDPEDMREVVRAYQETCAHVIHRFEGHIAQYLGDGLLIYFGYPRAHEDDPGRAVRAGLGIVAALHDLNARLERDKGVTVAVRIGIHTGPVVVGQIGAGVRKEQLALGETPNLAARLQGLADPDTIVISAATHRLVQGLFVCRDLGAQSLRGISTPVGTYCVLRESAARSRLEMTSVGELTPLVGREQEVGLLVDRWEQVKEGLGQVVLVSGEAGVGKSRLVHVLKEHVADELLIRWECRCSAYHQDSALFPVIDLMERALEFSRDESPQDKLRKIEKGLARCGLADPEAVSLWASLLSVPLPERYRPLNLTPQRQKQKTFEAVVRLLLALAAQAPMLFIVEDLHWIDPSTQELLDLVLQQVPTASVMVLLTFRSEFRPPWGARSHISSLMVNRFTRKQAESMVERVTRGKALPAEVLQQVVAKTDGVPLFVEELTKMILESGLLRDQDDRYALTGPLPPLAIPTTLQDSLMARLDRLAGVKEVAQLGATLGRAFPYELLRAVSSLDETTLQRSLARLVEAELLYQRGVLPDATYIFKHALIQEAAYHSLLKSRRQQVHQRIAQVLAERFPEIAETQPELLAHHYSEAGLAAQAVEYWQRAGERAIQRSASLEAIAHLTRGLEVLKILPDSPERAEHELLLQVTLGVPLWARMGSAAPEVERVHARALELCRQVGETPHLFSVLRRLGAVYLVRGELRTGLDLHEQCLSLAQRLEDPGLVAQGHFIVGDDLLWFGELVSARAHLEQSLALYDPTRDRARALLRYGCDPGMASLSFLGRVLWHLGYPDQAVKYSNQAIAIAGDVSHPFSQTWALSWAAALHQLRREVERVRELAEADVTLATEQAIPFFGAHGMILRGWALIEQGQRETGMAQLRQGLADYRATGAELERSHWLGLLAEACVKTEQIEEGLDVLAEALADVSLRGIRYYEAELYRLRGELMLRRRPAAESEAEGCFHRGVEIARRQSAKSWELRTAISLSRLWRAQGNRQEARTMLTETYGWFTEGFDTADLRDAKQLLDELSGV